MLKWIVPAQKLTLDSPQNRMSQTSRKSEFNNRRQCMRRATIANKENIPYVTSTPMVRSVRSSSIVLTPLADVLNITPEINSPEHSGAARTPSYVTIAQADNSNVSFREERMRMRKLSQGRCHSTLGITLPSAAPAYARTLPRFQVEEYSPSSLSAPAGQLLALRGLLPDPFYNNARYFTTPDTKEQQNINSNSNIVPYLDKRCSLKKRKRELEYTEKPKQKLLKPASVDTTTASSAKMGDETLDKLIDAILYSARKDVKKQKPRVSFNLRRRTLLRQSPDTVHQLVLSPSYTAAEDPASDLSLLLTETEPSSAKPDSSCLKGSITADRMVAMPTPLTPPSSDVPDSTSLLCTFPTSTQPSTPNFSKCLLRLNTPIAVHQSRERRLTHQMAGTNAVTPTTSRAKKIKVDASSYFKIGVALPSVYV